MSDSTLGNKIDNLSSLLGMEDAQEIEQTLSVLNKKLTRAFYLWFWWIHPDGSWTPWHHWGGQTDYRYNVQEQEFRKIEKSDNPQGEIDRIFSKGRQHFSDVEYGQIYPMFRLFFILQKKNIFNERALGLLKEINDEFHWESFPDILSQASYIGFVGEDSYTESEKQERKHREFLAQEKERNKRLQKEKEDNERIGRLRFRIREHLINKNICPDCKIEVSRWWNCSKCQRNILLIDIPF